MEKIKEMFGLEFPVFQGGMANIANGRFAAAISEAGAMGIIGSGSMDRETLKKLSSAKSAGAAFIADCDTAIAVFADGSRADTWVEDCSIAMSYMMLEAESLGVGSCWVQFHLRSGADGSDAEANLREILSVPEKYRIAGILSLGIPAEKPKAHSAGEADWGKVTYIK